MAQEVVDKMGIVRESGYMYFLRGLDVCKTPMHRKGGPVHPGGEQLVKTGLFIREKGYLYFLDKNGDVARAKQAHSKPTPKAE